MYGGSQMEVTRTPDSTSCFVFFLMCVSYVCQVVPLPGSADPPVLPLPAQSRQSCHFAPNLRHVGRGDVLHDLPRPPPDNQGVENKDGTSRGRSNASKVHRKTMQWEE